MIYFIQEDRDGPIKIGVASNVKRRLQGLQVSSAHELHLRATMNGNALVEKELHERFAEWRIRGEWFKPAPPVLALIEQHAQKKHPERHIVYGVTMATCRMCGLEFNPKSAQDKIAHANRHDRIRYADLPHPMVEYLKDWGYSIVQTGKPGAFFPNRSYSKEEGKCIMAIARWIDRHADAVDAQDFEAFMANQLDEFDRIYTDEEKET